MANFKNIAKGIGFPLMGMVAGLWTGLAGSVVYIAGRVLLHIPNSLPTLDLSISEKNISLAKILTCLNEHKANCLPPIENSIDTTPFTYPIAVGACTMVAAGALVGTGYVLYDLHKQRRDAYKILAEDDFDTFTNQFNGSLQV